MLVCTHSSFGPRKSRKTSSKRMHKFQRVNSKQVILDYVQQFHFSKHLRPCSLEYTNRAYLTENGSGSYYFSRFSRVDPELKFQQRHVMSVLYLTFCL